MNSYETLNSYDNKINDSLTIRLLKLADKNIELNRKLERINVLIKEAQDPTMSLDVQGKLFDCIEKLSNNY